MDRQSPTLAELQSWMKWIITDPRGVSEALHSSPISEEVNHKERYTEPSPRALEFIQVPQHANISDRLDIYAEAYFSRLLESLTSDFSLTCYLIGEDPFKTLIADYLKKHPSKFQNIGEVGLHLPAFIQDQNISHEHPYLHDSALMEWSAIASFYTKPPCAIDIAKLSTMTAEEESRVAFRFNDSLRTLNSRWPLDQLWLLKESKNTDELTMTVSATPDSYLIFQNQGHVQVEKISAFENDMLERLGHQAPLTKVLEELAITYPEQELSMVGPLFEKWISRNFIQEILL